MTFRPADPKSTAYSVPPLGNELVPLGGSRTHMASRPVDFKSTAYSIPPLGEGRDSV